MPNHRHLRRGIYLLPTLFTVGNLFGGFSSVLLSSVGRLETAALMILLAAVLDGLDGRIARLTGTTSAFGIEFDSLADVVSFGVAPAMLAFHWGLGPGRIGWSLAFLFVVSAATRLARYNIQTPALDKRFFVGLPAPMAGGVLASLVFTFPQPADSPWAAVGLAVLVPVLAIAMVSRVRYWSFRELDLRNRRSYVYVLPISATLVAIVMRPKVVLPVLCVGYLLSGPILWIRDRSALRAGFRTASDKRSTTDPEVADEPAIR